MPRRVPQAEDDGWLLGPLLDYARGRTDIAVFDSRERSAARGALPTLSAPAPEPQGEHPSPPARMRPADHHRGTMQNAAAQRIHARALCGCGPRQPLRGGNRAIDCRTRPSRTRPCPLPHVAQRAESHRSHRPIAFGSGAAYPLRGPCLRCLISPVMSWASTPGRTVAPNATVSAALPGAPETLERYASGLCRAPMRYSALGGPGHPTAPLFLSEDS